MKHVVFDISAVLVDLESLPAWRRDLGKAETAARNSTGLDALERGLKARGLL